MIGKKRSDRQNKYYFKCIVLLLGNELGYRKQEMHSILLNKFAAERSKEMSVTEFDDYCECIRCWAMQELSIKVPLPNEC